MKIAVLGAGSWGTTLAILLFNNGHDVTLWEFKKSYAKTMRKSRENKVYLPGVKIPDDIIIETSITDACKGAHMLILSTPTQFLRGVLKDLKGVDLSDTTLVSVAKGIEKGTLLTVSEIIKDVLPEITDEYIGVLSGPSHAEEVCNKIPTAVVSASQNENTAKSIQLAFNNAYFRVYSSTDIKGVELGGALKNVIAIGAGIIDGAGYGDNTKALIMTRGVAEISRLGIELGARPETFAGLSGMGDLIVTCMSQHSRNRFVGQEVGKGRTLTDVLKSMEMVAEGVESCRSVHQLAAKCHVDTPIVNAVHKILFDGKDPIKATFDLMTRELKAEH